MPHETAKNPNNSGSSRSRGRGGDGTPLDARIAQVARRQYGVVARPHLLEVGVGENEIEYRLAIGRLHPIHREVYSVGHRVVPRPGRWMAAVLDTGPDAVLSHRSAAASGRSGRILGTDRRDHAAQEPLLGWDQAAPQSAAARRGDGEGRNSGDFGAANHLRPGGDRGRRHHRLDAARVRTPQPLGPALAPGPRRPLPRPPRHQQRSSRPPADHRRALRSASAASSRNGSRPSSAGTTYRNLVSTTGFSSAQSATESTATCPARARSSSWMGGKPTTPVPPSATTAPSTCLLLKRR